MKPASFIQLDSPVGVISIVEQNQKIVAVALEKQWPDVARKFPHLESTETKLLNLARQQLQQYFEGSRQKFDLPLELNGTEFEQGAWLALRDIPFGLTRTYKEQACIIGNPKAVRAIGRANGKNPIAIIIPCHRVIGASGSLTGYAGGLEAKEMLLKFEQKHV